MFKDVSLQTLIAQGIANNNDLKVAVAGDQAGRCKLSSKEGFPSTKNKRRTAGNTAEAFQYIMRAVQTQMVSDIATDYYNLLAMINS